MGPVRVAAPAPEGDSQPVVVVVVVEEDARRSPLDLFSTAPSLDPVAEAQQRKRAEEFLNNLAKKGIDVDEWIRQEKEKAKQRRAADFSRMRTKEDEDREARLAVASQMGPCQKAGLGMLVGMMTIGKAVTSPLRALGRDYSEQDAALEEMWRLLQIREDEQKATRFGTEVGAKLASEAMAAVLLSNAAEGVGGALGETQLAKSIISSRTMVPIINGAHAARVPASLISGAGAAYMGVEHSRAAYYSYQADDIEGASTFLATGLLEMATGGHTIGDGARVVVLRYRAQAILQRLTDQVNARLAADPSLATTVLRPKEIEASLELWVRRMNYGKAVERLVAQEIKNSAELREMFRHIGYISGGPDFQGIGALHGMTFDITTERQILAHLSRPYGDRVIIIVYVRPAWAP
jgi:hypothetical protein